MRHTEILASLILLTCIAAGYASAQENASLRVRGVMESLEMEDVRPANSLKRLDFYASCGMNTYFYAPVDDPSRGAEGWKFLYSMKQNECFVFPNSQTGFDPKEVDLINPDNYALISPNLFRIQAISTKDYLFRHHLETNVARVKELHDVTWKRINSLSNMHSIVKVRLDHLGRIVQVGEY